MTHQNDDWTMRRYWLREVKWLVVGVTWGIVVRLPYWAWRERSWSIAWLFWRCWYWPCYVQHCSKDES